VGKIRPQIMAAIIGLLTMGIIALHQGVESLAVGSVTGVVALAKDVLQSDNND